MRSTARARASPGPVRSSSRAAARTGRARTARNGSPCASATRSRRFVRHDRAVQTSLLAWYARHGRDLPWRKTRDPYAVLVSEVMLQQTQASRVVPRWLAWLERWPTAEALADAPTAEVIREWQGLGYNRRAVSLQRAARAVAQRGWPRSEEHTSELQSRRDLVCRLLLEKKKSKTPRNYD